MKLSSRYSLLFGLLLSVCIAVTGCTGGQSSISVAEVASDIIFGSVPVAATKPAVQPRLHIPAPLFPFNLNFGFNFPNLTRSGNCPPSLATQAVQDYSTLDVTAPPLTGTYRWLSTLTTADASGATKTASGFDQRQVANVFDVKSTPAQSGLVFTGNGSKTILHYTYDMVQPTANGGKLVTSYVVNSWDDVNSQYGTGEPGAPGNIVDPDGGLAFHSQTLYDGGGNVVASFRPSTDLMLMPLPVGATGSPPNSALDTPGGPAPASAAFAPGWSFTGRDATTGETVQISGEIASTKPKTVDACGTLLDGIQVYTQMVSGNCPASEPTSTCLGTAGGAVPGTTAPCPQNLLCDEYDLVVDTGLGGVVIASDLSGSAPTSGSQLDDKEQIAGAPPATAAADLCPAAPSGAKVQKPSTTDVTAQPGAAPIQAGGYRWLTQDQLTDASGATTSSGGIEQHGVTNVSAVTQTPSTSYNLNAVGATSPAPQYIESYSFDVTQPTGDGGHSVTNYVVHSFSDANYASSQIVDPDGGLSLHSRILYDKSGKVVDSFQPGTDLLLLNLPVAAEGTPPEGPSPAQPGFSFVAQDPNTHMTVEMDVEVYVGTSTTSPKPVTINACGGLVDGWEVFSQVKTAICSANVSTQQCLNNGNATKNEYDYFVSTALGGLIVQSQLTGASSQGAGWTVDDFEHMASTTVSKGSTGS